MLAMLACSVAASPGGELLLSKLEALTGVNWTASTDETGGTAGANWAMESDGVAGASLDYFAAQSIGAWSHSLLRVNLPAPRRGGTRWTKEQIRAFRGF